jgi:hypothetical protein
MELWSKRIFKCLLPWGRAAQCAKHSFDLILMAVFVAPFPHHSNYRNGAVWTDVTFCFMPESYANAYSTLTFGTLHMIRLYIRRSTLVGPWDLFNEENVF